jgi:hypothetical protein
LFAPAFFSESTSTLRYVLKTSAAVTLRDYDNIPTSAVSTAIVQQAVYPRSAAETAALITPTNYGYPVGDVRRYGAIADSGITSNQTAFQNALTANAGAAPVVIEGTSGAYYGGFSGPLTVPAGSHIQFRNGAEMRWASTTASGPTYLGSASRPGFNVTGSNVRIEGKGIITGPSGTGVYTASEIGIIAIGTSAAVPLSSIYIGPQLELRWWGSDGIVLQYVVDFDIRGNTIHDCGYAGVHHLTTKRGTIHGNEVYNITPGTSGNAYGISGTFYGSPTNSRSDANHFPIGIDVGHNYVHDIPLWIGIDFHGAFDCDVHDNRVNNCWTAIQVASGNDYGGENNIIRDNVCNINTADGGATTVVNTAPMGITINGGGTSRHVNCRVEGNVILGYGNSLSPPTAYSIQASFVEKAIISGNTFGSWQGYGIYTSASLGGRISGNVFGALGGTYVNSACIQVQTASTPWVIDGNEHRIASGTAAAFGCTINGSTPVPVVGNNDFYSATTAQYGNGSGGALAATAFAGQSNPLVVGSVGTGITTKLKGTQALAGVTTQAVAFGVTLPSSTYQVSLCASSTGGPFWTTSKSATGFTINAGSSYTGNVDWIVEQ